MGGTETLVGNTILGFNIEVDDKRQAYSRLSKKFPLVALRNKNILLNVRIQELHNWKEFLEFRANMQI